MLVWIIAVVMGYAAIGHFLYDMMDHDHLNVAPLPYWLFLWVPIMMFLFIVWGMSFAIVSLRKIVYRFKTGRFTKQ